jgi:hypothetical protein
MDRVGEKRNAYRVLKDRDHYERRRCEDNIKMDIREMTWGDMNWIHVAEDMGQWWAFVNTVMDLDLRVP